MKAENVKLVGAYVRVSTADQQKGLASQVKALTDYCENHGFTDVRWYKDILSGSTVARPAFEKLQADIFSGKVHCVVCWKLDRLSRSLRDGVNVLTDWLEKGVRIVAVCQQLDFSGTVGQMVAGILFALAQMERENLRENTRRGLQAAKARGVRLGKRAKLFSRDILPMLDSGQTMATVAEKLGRTRQALYLCLKREGVVRA